MSRHDAYDAVVVVHALVAVVSFGAIAVSGVYGSTASRPHRWGGAEEVRRYFTSPSVAAIGVVAVAPLGAVALVVDPRGGSFAHGWVLAAGLLWLVASALWAVVVRPAEVALSRAVRGGDGEPSWSGPGRRIARASAATDVIFVVALALMIFQPG